MTSPQQNFVHAHVTCQKCGGCIYECEHRVKTTLTTTTSDDNIGATVTPPQHSDEWLDEVLKRLWSKAGYGEDYDSVAEAKQAILAELKKREAAARMDITKVDLNWRIGDLTVHHLPEHIIKAALAQLHKEQQEESK